MPDTAIPPAGELRDLPSDTVLENDDLEAILNLASVIDTMDTAYTEGITMDGHLVVRIEAVDDATGVISGDLGSLLEDTATIVNADHHFFSHETAFENLSEDQQEKISAGEIDDLEAIDKQIEEQFEAWRAEHNVAGDRVDNILRLEIAV